MQDVLEPLNRRKRQLSALIAELGADTVELAKVRKQVDAYDRFDPKSFFAEISRLHAERDGLSSALKDIDSAIARNLRELSVNRGKTVSLLRPLQYFSTEQVALRSKIAAQSDRHLQLDKSAKGLQADIAECQQDIGNLEQQLQEHAQFDREEAVAAMRALRAGINQKKVEIQLVEEQLDTIQERLGALITDYQGARDRLQKIEKDLESAKNFQEQLECAENGYERAMIHQECGSVLGVDRPRQVIKTLSYDMRGVTSDIRKMEVRLRDGFRRMEIKPSHIIIDGNNACYRTTEFIRMTALTRLVDALTPTYRVTVVFDASIRRLMQADDAKIQQIIGRSASVHIAPTRHTADEYILKLSEGAKDSFILSNDRYGEFQEFDAVKSNRLLRFMIADDVMMVNDLGLSVSLPVLS